MSDFQFVQIRSWHVVRTATRVPNRYVTVCGRSAEGPISETLPGGKSCETCLRIGLRSVDPGAGEDDGSTWTDSEPMPAALSFTVTVSNDGITLP